MKSWKKLNKESNAIVALVIISQDYVLFDEEFSKEKKIQKNLNNPDFWINVAQSAYEKTNSFLSSNILGDTIEQIDSIEDGYIDSAAILNYISNPKNRFEINDFICTSIEEWLAL